MLAHVVTDSFLLCAGKGGSVVMFVQEVVMVDEGVADV